MCEIKSPPELRSTRNIKRPHCCKTVGSKAAKSSFVRWTMGHSIPAEQRSTQSSKFFSAFRATGQYSVVLRSCSKAAAIFREPFGTSCRGNRVSQYEVRRYGMPYYQVRGLLRNKVTAAASRRCAKKKRNEIDGTRTRNFRRDRAVL
jgi:hypothetical protein